MEMRKETQEIDPGESCRKDGSQKKWPPQFRSLDPTLSEVSFPLPGIENQPEGATSCRISLPATPISDVFRPIGSSFLVQRTNLLSPSVTHLPVFKVSQITATNMQFSGSPQARQQEIFGNLSCTGNPQDICPALRQLLIIRKKFIVSNTGNYSDPIMMSELLTTVLSIR